MRHRCSPVVLWVAFKPGKESQLYNAEQRFFCKLADNGDFIEHAYGSQCFGYLRCRLKLRVLHKARRIDAIARSDGWAPQIQQVLNLKAWAAEMKVALGCPAARATERLLDTYLGELSRVGTHGERI